MSKQEARSDGQRDGNAREYTGSLFSGRTAEEQKVYNEGYIQGEGTRDGNAEEYTGSLFSGRTAEEQKVYSEAYEAARTT